MALSTFRILEELEADSAIDQARHPRSRGPLATAAAWISLSLTITSALHFYFSAVMAVLSEGLNF